MIEVGNYGKTSEIVQVLAFVHICKKNKNYLKFKIHTQFNI